MFNKYYIIKHKYIILILKMNKIHDIEKLYDKTIIIQ